jgi:DnaJ-domain-containing protein 1
MSVGRRLLDMARSELNSLLDFAAKHGNDGDGDDGGDGDAAGAGEPVRAGAAAAWREEAEWQRRARQEVEDAIHGRRTPEPPPPPPRERPSGGGRGPRTASSASASNEGLRVQKAYAALEVRPGSDFATVRQSYRALMRKYHPDHHTESAETQRAANEVAQRLTDAYKLLEKKLRK